VSDEKREKVSMDEVDAEDAVSLPNKEVMSLLDVNANVDLGLELAAPVDLAAAANLNVAAPIEASAAANVASPDAQAVSEAYQHGSIDQSITGDSTAVAPQHASVAQDSSNAFGSDQTPSPTAGEPSGTTVGGADSLLNGGSLLDANINVHADANLAAPVDGAVAAQANVAAPVDAAVAANVASPGAAAEALAPQQVDIHQSIDGNTNATAEQDAEVTQK
jgi:hypothetical protein